MNKNLKHVIKIAAGFVVAAIIYYLFLAPK